MLENSQICLRLPLFFSFYIDCRHWNSSDVEMEGTQRFPNRANIQIDMQIVTE